MLAAIVRGCAQETCRSQVRKTSRLFGPEPAEHAASFVDQPKLGSRPQAPALRFWLHACCSEFRLTDHEFSCEGPVELAAITAAGRARPWCLPRWVRARVRQQAQSPPGAFVSCNSKLGSASQLLALEIASCFQRLLMHGEDMSL